MVGLASLAAAAGALLLCLWPIPFTHAAQPLVSNSANRLMTTLAATPDPGTAITEADVHSLSARLQRLHSELPQGERALFEELAAFDRFGIEAVDFVDANEAVVFFALLRPARLTFDHVAAAKFETPDLRLAYIDVFVADDVAAASEETVALRQDVENTARHLEPGTLLHAGENRGNDFVFLHRRRIAERNLVGRSDLDEFGLLSELEIGCRQRRQSRILLRKVCGLLS